jgi:hypothetical protein
VVKVAGKVVKLLGDQKFLVAQAGGKVDDKFAAGTLGAAQFAYTSKAKKADRVAMVTVLAGLKDLAVAG